MTNTRRSFIKQIAASLGIGALGGGRVFAAPPGWKPPKGANLVFGVISDTHLRTDYTGLKAARTFPHKYFISALEYFRSQNVDAVVHCGDAAHRGQIRELEFHAEAWNKVFPKGLAPDGHRIEKLFVTGNHEIDGWQYGNDVGFKVERVFKDPEERARRILATDIASSWKRVWGETYEPVWHKEVKGYHFFGRHYGVAEGQIARLVKEVEKKQGFRDGRRPFFVLSHIRPHAALNRAMAKFPESISLFGHWHHSASNWNVIFDWNGAIAIQVPACLPKGWLPLAHDAYITKAKLEGGEREKIGVARHGYVFRLYDDMMAIERREFGEGGSLGEDWVMPLGSFSPHPFSKAGLKKSAGEPQFPNGAKLSVKLEKRVGELHISIPLANGNPKCRVYAYEVAIKQVAADNAATGKSAEILKAVYAAGVNLGMGHEPNKGVTTLEIGRSELPKGERFVVSVTPLTSVGTRGRPITANVS